MEKVYAAIIAGAVSIVVAFATTIWRTRVELRKHSEEIRENYASKLFESRLEKYPSLYSILSEYSKQIQYHLANYDSMLKLQIDLDKWNNENGVLLNVASAKISARFRNLLHAMAGSRVTLSESDLEKIRFGLLEFERSLKAEIGVSIIEPVGQSSSFLEAANRLDQMVVEIENEANKVIQPTAEAAPD